MTGLVELNEASEAEWDRLRTALDLDRDGFWLALLCTSAAQAADVLRARTEQVVQLEGGRVRHVTPSQPDDLAAAVLDAVADAGPGVVIIWVSAVDDSPTAPRRGSWASAWANVLLRLNERRDALPRAFDGGLVLAGPSELNEWTRELATDLWSIRRIVLRVDTADGIAPERKASDPPRTTDLSGSAHGPYPDIDETAELPSLSPTTIAWLREAVRLRATGVLNEATDLLRGALAQARPPDVTQSQVGVLLTALSEIEVEAGEEAIAFQHAATALRLGVRLGLHRRRRLLERLRERATELQDWQSAAAFAELHLRLQRRSADDRRASALRDLDLSLNRVGDIAKAAGRQTDADTAYREAIELARRLLDTYGRTPTALEDLRYPLRRRIEVGEALGEDVDALRTELARLEELEDAE